MELNKFGELESDILKDFDIILEEPVGDESENDLFEVEYNDFNFVSSGLNFPNATSQHDIKDGTDWVLVRYRYAGKSTPQRDFCKLMKEDKKVYRKEDILEMGRQPVNPGFGPEGADTYSIWLYKGGVNCYHFWSRVVYLRKGFDISSIKRIGIGNLNIQLPTLESEVETRPIDMPNQGRLNMEKQKEIIDMNRPVFIIDVDELTLDKGVNFISLVDIPAMELDWIALRDEIELDFSVDVDKKLLYGVFVVPDKLIYRKGLDGYVVFTKENIEKLVKKWSKNDYNKNINILHTNNKVDAFVREQWIVEDSKNDKINKYIKDVKDGSWVGIVEIEDDNFWKDYIKSGLLKGFSIEMIPDELIKMKPKEVKEEKFESETERFTIDESIDLIKSILKKYVK